SGIALFLVGSALCGLAGGMAALVVFRAIQGIGSGALVPVALTIVGDLYAPAERARMQGILSSVWAVAAILGPVVGAYLVAHLSSAMVFWVNVPIGIIAAAMLAATLREGPLQRRHAIDYPGAALMTIGITLLMIALVEASALSAPLLRSLLAAAVAALVLLI